MKIDCKKIAKPCHWFCPDQRKCFPKHTFKAIPCVLTPGILCRPICERKCEIRQKNDERIKELLGYETILEVQP